MFESLIKLRDLKAERFIPGYGPVCGPEAIEKQQRYMEKMVEIGANWNPAEGETAIPSSTIEELLGFYPLQGRPVSMMRDRVIESICVVGDPQFSMGGPVFSHVIGRKCRIFSGNLMLILPICE